jgi:hypothetical protein
MSMINRGDGGNDRAAVDSRKIDDCNKYKRRKRFTEPGVRSTQRNGRRCCEGDEKTQLDDVVGGVFIAV